VRQVTRHEVDRPLDLCSLLQGQCIGGVVDYDPYGVVTRREGSMLDTLGLGYTGEMTDASGLVYLRSRYYNPATGGFLTQNMSEGALGRVNAHNGYAYVEGNPANFVSPGGLSRVATGHATCCWYPTRDPHAFGKGLFVFGVATAVAFATMGLGSALAPAILGAAPSTLAATIYGGAWVGASGIAAGQASIATGNVMSGRDVREGLFRGEDMLRDAAFAIGGTAFFSAIAGVNLFTTFLPQGRLSRALAKDSGGLTGIDRFDEFAVGTKNYERWKDNVTRRGFTVYDNVTLDPNRAAYIDNVVAEAGRITGGEIYIDLKQFRYLDM
jgi:RHS repeat-associated protein